MDNLEGRVDRYYDPTTNVTYDWDDDFRCYIGYIAELISDDPFYYRYETPPVESDDEGALKPRQHEDEDILALLEPTRIRSRSSVDEVVDEGPDPYSTRVDAKVSVQRENLYGKKATPKPAKAAPVKTEDAEKEKEMKRIRQELEKEVKQAAKEGQQGRRSLTRRLTRKLTTIGNTMSVQEQLNLLADVKKEAGSIEMDDEAINQYTATENAAAAAREIAKKVLKKKAPVGKTLAMKPP
ncbi:hypothetical protein GNI_138410 [Gregarina niphandrodes]|uniref:Uncharacterized protein n=1 Tax=Gregarina niphandrodes TaxID=110365 RepID=A0A023B0M7_GRENI|nr:hypothetical protein GNI_138410 [Gregarina niphandrodes]EZG45473.1 hypothetical protein GNI_138410 [Gregarina niphandrodes]|eukprot:XP_011132491.1 hypothetical protein GNI_138410 [Gregarina niphandrodes]